MFFKKLFTSSGVPLKVVPANMATPVVTWLNTKEWHTDVWGKSDKPEVWNRYAWNCKKENCNNNSEYGNWLEIVFLQKKGSLTIRVWSLL